MKANQAVYSVALLCRVLGVSASGYYAWLERLPSRRAQADEQLSVRIRELHTRSRETYGMPRIHAELADAGTPVGRKRVARLMARMGLAGISRRTGFKTTVRDRDACPAPDLVARRFTAEQPDRLWVADITYVPTLAGFLFLAVVLDVCTRRIVGWAMANHLRTALILDALNMAIWQRRPIEVIHHSDQGTQYTSIAFGLRCKQVGVRPSMGSVGDCLRLRDVRELLRHTRMRAARPPALRNACSGSYRDLRVHRRLVQPASSALIPRLLVTRSIREEHKHDPQNP